MKATGIVRRIDDLGRVVIPKEIRRTMRIREGDPLLTTLTPMERPAAAGGTGRRTGMRAVVFRTKGGVAPYSIPRAQCGRRRPGKTFVNFFLAPVSLRAIML